MDKVKKYHTCLIGAQHILKSEKILFLNHATDTVVKG